MTIAYSISLYLALSYVVWGFVTYKRMNDTVDRLSSIMNLGVFTIDQDPIS